MVMNVQECSDERAANWYKLPGSGCSEVDTGPEFVVYVYVFYGSLIIICRLKKLTLSAQVKVILQQRASLSNLV